MLRRLRAGHSGMIPPFRLSQTPPFPLCHRDLWFPLVFARCMVGGRNPHEVSESCYQAPSWATESGVRVPVLRLACWPWSWFPANCPRQGWGRERLLHLWNERNRLLPSCPPGVRRCLHACEPSPPAFFPPCRSPGPNSRLRPSELRDSPLPSSLHKGFPFCPLGSWAALAPRSCVWLCQWPLPPRPSWGSPGKGGHHPACSISTGSMISVRPHSCMGTFGGCPPPATSLAA